MRRIVLLLSMASVPNMALAQLSHSPLPPVPAMEPLYPRTAAARHTPPASRPRPVIVASKPAPARPAAVAPAPVQLASIARPVAPPPIVALPVGSPVIITPPAAPPMVMQAAAGEMVIPPNIDMLVRLDQEVSSKGRKVGDSFKLTVIQDVMHNGMVVIPRGTPAFGSIAWRTGKGMFGKSAKMEITVDRLSLNGRDVPLFGRFREEGEGNTGATIGTAVAAGLIAAAFVTGRSAVFPSGREFRVSTREAFTLAPPAPFAPSLVTAARR